MTAAHTIRHWEVITSPTTVKEGEDEHPHLYIATCSPTHKGTTDTLWQMTKPLYPGIFRDTKHYATVFNTVLHLYGTFLSITR